MRKVKGAKGFGYFRCGTAAIAYPGSTPGASTDQATVWLYIVRPSDFSAEV